jgi:hypothetical protein
MVQLKVLKVFPQELLNFKRKAILLLLSLSDVAIEIVGVDRCEIGVGDLLEVNQVTRVLLFTCRINRVGEIDEEDLVSIVVLHIGVDHVVVHVVFFYVFYIFYVFFDIFFYISDIIVPGRHFFFLNRRELCLIFFVLFFSRVSATETGVLRLQTLFLF